MPNTYLIDVVARQERAERRRKRDIARFEAQSKALDHLLKMGTPLSKIFSPAPWSLKKPKGFHLRVSSNVPHQGERERTRRMRQAGACWA